MAYTYKNTSNSDILIVCDEFENKLMVPSEEINIVGSIIDMCVQSVAHSSMHIHNDKAIVLRDGVELSKDQSLVILAKTHDLYSSYANYFDNSDLANEHKVFYNR